MLKKALNDALNIIIKAFKNRIIESEYHPDLVVGNDLSNNRESDFQHPTQTIMSLMVSLTENCKCLANILVTKTLKS